MNPRHGMFYWQADRPYSSQQVKGIFLDWKQLFDKAEFISVIANSLKEIGIEKQPIIANIELINYGSTNVVCSFKTDLGYEGVIRAFPPQATNSYFYVEQHVMRLARVAGVSTATVRYISADKIKFPFQFMLMDKVPGTVMQIEVEKNPNLYRTYLTQLGEQIAKIHTIHTKGYGFFDPDQSTNDILQGQYSSNEENFLAALDKDELFYKEHPNWIDSSQIRKTIQILKRNSSIYTYDKPVLIHNDIADWNTIVDGDKVTGIMDWDECFSGDPLFEFAAAKLFYPDERFEYLIEGYSHIADRPEVTSEKFHLYVLRYILSKSKISITKLSSIEKKSTRDRFETTKKLLTQILTSVS